MENVIDLRAWRKAKVDEGSSPADPKIHRLELAISRLEKETAARFERSEKLEPPLETELLAILGALASDLIDDAADRAERLARRLSRETGT
jgi:hypothetical protein